ncbi:DoxX family protein [Staphylococcus edaphicus]|uniref:DoxX family protein n=1 Tax=Staphylococcus edaphicus TaxID=1955013 RepID=A0A2C6WLX6_9STAP|nr:hypothetical protein [Staphylococcus edaphicus]PHK49085.1 hypothetical protein BTJ66_10075 [Staphylococcus edaphicus]UQW82274.1 hypothetical protein MNY58_04025 [Staphylococcus edaphicus]
MTKLRILFGIVFSVAGILHFKDEAQFRKIVPAYLPFRKAAVLITGIIELVFGAILLIKKPTNSQKNTMIAFLWAVLPANIYMARKQIPLAGKQLPKWILYGRIPLQFVIIKLIKKL